MVVSQQQADSFPRLQAIHLSQVTELEQKHTAAVEDTSTRSHEDRMAAETMCAQQACAIVHKSRYFWKMGTYIMCVCSLRVMCDV